MSVRATSTGALRRAVVYALTHPGINERMPADKLFDRTWPAEVAARGLPSRARGAVFVTVRDHVIEPTMEMTDRRRETVRVLVTVFYWAGSELHLSEVDSQMDRLDEDRHIICSTLALPGALEFDPRDRNILTGLDGGSLRTDGYSSTGPDLIATEDRILRVIHSFRATVELAHPSR